MKIEWVSYFFFFIAALIHVYIFVLESFLFQKPEGYKAFKMKKEDHEAAKQWALSQGVYNLFLAIAMFMGLYYVNQLEIKTAGAMVSFSGLSMITAGVVLLVTNKKMIKGALIQIVPPLLGFFFLAFHIIEKIKGAGN
jgi:putative membrane protein